MKAKPVASARQRRVKCREYVCEHGIVQSTCKCTNVDKERIPLSCRTDCPGIVKRKAVKRARA